MINVYLIWILLHITFTITSGEADVNNDNNDNGSDEGNNDNSNDGNDNYSYFCYFYDDIFSTQ